MAAIAAARERHSAALHFRNESIQLPKLNSFLIECVETLIYGKLRISVGAVCMNRKFLSLLLLGTGMAVGQTGSTSTGAQGQNPQTSQPGTSGLNPIQQTLRGCLRQSGGSWTLSQTSQDTALSGDPAMLKPHDGQQVEVQGSQPIGGVLQVTSVITISNACLGQSSSTNTTKPSNTTSDSTGRQSGSRSSSSTAGQSSTSNQPSHPSSTPGASGQAAPPAQTQPSAGSGSGTQPAGKPPMTE